MRVNLEWLREWVDFESDGNTLAEQLTTAGLEVDDVLPVSGGISGVVLARVESVEPHPAADRLSVCRVDDGTDLHEVVCGAPNVSPGIVAPFAPIGSGLPGGREIRAVTVRGVRSNGMLCSGKELELSEDGSGLLLLDADAPVGVSLAEYLRLDDEILDLDLTPNRGDCFSVIGIAREIAAHLRSRLRGPTLDSVPAVSNDSFAVELLAPEACPRFAGRVIRGVSNDAHSPFWLRERLRRAGVRTINPVVDVTNYVMLELGQPLHAYDLDKLDRKIVVRFANADERLVLLDGKEIALDDDVLVIAGAEFPIGMAGIMGGAGTGVSETTSDVFLESAFFAPEAVSGRARRYGLHTDASLRFERGVDPEGASRAIERATALLVQIAGGAPGPTVMTEHVDAVPDRSRVRLRQARVESVLGMKLEPSDIEGSLTPLELHLEPIDAGWWVTPPSFRFDIEIEEDLIEEVGRMIGYDAIPASTGQCTAHLGRDTETRISEERVTDLLIDRGYSEIVSYGFIDEELDQLIHPGTPSLKLKNPISADLSVMRRSLWPGLLLAAQKNLSRQINDFRLFECGSQFSDGVESSESMVIAGLVCGSRTPEHWDTKPVAADFYDMKSDVEAAIGLSRAAENFTFVAEEHPALTVGQTARLYRDSEPVGWLGAVHPRVLRIVDIKQTLYAFALRFDAAFRSEIPEFTAVSKFPFVRRDIAVIVDEELSADELKAQARAAAGPLLADLIVFDVYRGPGIDATRKSVAIGLILQDASRTLTDSDADNAVQSVSQHLQREFGATIRT